MYEFNSAPPNYEDEYEDEEFIQTLYDLKYTIVDKWNSELIWGNSNPVRNNDWWQIFATNHYYALGLNYPKLALNSICQLLCTLNHKVFE